MGKKHIFFILGTLILMLSLPIVALAKTEYTATTETDCVDNVCTKTLYSGIRHVFENNKWVRIEDSKGSLKEYFNVVYLKEDPDLEIIVDDFTYDSINLRLKVKNADKLNKDIPFKIDSVEKIKFKFKKLKDEKGATVISDTTILGRNYSFGENSTVLTLQDADTENLEDTYLDQEDSDDCGGEDADTYIRVRVADGSNYTMIYKFDITDIPADSTITDGTLSLYALGETIDSGEEIIVYAHHVFNNFTVDGLAWVEGTGNCDANSEICWDERPLIGEYNATSEYGVTFTGPSPANDQFVGWSVTNMVITDYDDGNNNVSIYMVGQLISGSPSSGDHLKFESKEEPDTAKRPKLVITYTEPPEGAWNHTKINLFLNGTESNVYYENQTTVNFTAVVNSTGTINISSNITGFNTVSGSSPLSNYTTIECSSNNTYYNITGFFEANATHNASSTTHYAICWNTTVTPPEPAYNYTSVNLYLNGTEGNVYYENQTDANFTVVLNTSGTVNVSANITGWGVRSGASPLYNYTLMSCSANNTYYNITGFFEKTATHNESSVTHYAICWNTTVTTTTTTTTTTTLPAAAGVDYCVELTDTMLYCERDNSKFLILDLDTYRYMVDL